MFNQIDVGVQQVNDGAITVARADRQGGACVTELNSRYYENAYRGLMYASSNSAAQALSLTGTTTYTGMVVYNNPGSGKNLVLTEAIFTPTTAETGVGGVLLFSQPVAASLPTLTTTNVANGAFSTLLNGNTSSVAKVASACTLATNPVFLRPLISFQFGTAVGLNMLPGYKDELAGSVIVPPGAGVGFVAITTAITGLAYMSWVEIPV